METAVFAINRGAPFEKQLDGVNLRRPRRPMQSRLAVVVAGCRIDAPVEKKLRGVQAAVAAGVEKRRLDLFRIRFGPERAAFIEKTLKHVEAADCRRTLRIQRRAEIREEFCRGGLSIGNAAVNDGMAIASRRRAL